MISSSPAPYRFGFIVEQALGHKTHAQNLRAILGTESDVEIRWVLPDWQKTGLKAKMPVYRSNWTIQSGIQARHGLASLHRSFPFNGLFFHTQVPAILCTDWVQRFPSVVSLDATPIQYDSLGEAYQHAPGPAWLENAKFQLNRRCFHAARHLVTWSQWTKNGLAADYGVPDEKITVVPPGVNLNAWQRPADCPKDPGVVKILFVGGNLERKGGKELIEAFRCIQELPPGKLPRLELHLITQDAVPDLPNVFHYQGLKPNSPELKRLYFTADIFCLPTRGDCLPMALAEAGAAGLPIVSTQIAAIPEIVHDGENGFLIQPRDVKGLVEALTRLAEDASLRNAMGIESKRIVETDHNVEQNARRLLKILRGIIR